MPPAAARKPTTRELAVSASLASVPAFLEALLEAGRDLELSERLRDDLELVLEELFTNIVSYGGLDPATATVMVRLSRGRSTLAVELVDQGIPFNPLEQSPPDLDLSLEEREIGGLGIHFLRMKTARRCYRREDEANILRFAFRL